MPSPQPEALPALLPQSEDLPALVPKQEGAPSALISTTAMPQPELIQMRPVPAMDIPPVHPEFNQMRLVLTPISSNTRSKRLQQKTPKNVGLGTNASENIKIAHKKAKKSQAKRFRLDNSENIRENLPERLDLPMLNEPIGLNRPMQNEEVCSDGDTVEELQRITDLNTRSPLQPDFKSD